MFPSFPHFYKLSRNLSFPLVSKTFPMGSLTNFWKTLEIDIFSLTDFYSTQGTHWKCFGNQRKPQNNRFLLNLNFEPQGKELGLREKAGGGMIKKGLYLQGSSLVENEPIFISDWSNLFLSFSNVIL